MLATPPRRGLSGTIPFNRAVRLGTEAQVLREFLESGNQDSGAGPVGQQCEMLLERLVGKPVLLTTSATHALEMAALLARLGPGDEVIIPSYTFVSTANAFVLRGAKPVFADVDQRGNLALAEIARLRTPRTRAVCVVHYGGDACDMSELEALTEGLTLIEDAAQAIGSRQRGKHLGSFGSCGALSFHETKNIGCGEGGALILGHEELLRRAEVIREKGTNRRSFQLGLVDKYTWVDVGSSYVMPEISRSDPTFPVDRARADSPEEGRESRDVTWMISDRPSGPEESSSSVPRQTRKGTTICLRWFSLARNSGKSSSGA